MHYLEDYLELIEQLPTDLRERFTEMREMDLQVQNAIDDLDLKVKEFLSTCATGTQEWKEENYKNLKQEYSKAVDDAEEKVNIATQISDLVDRHLRKLDQELSKFKMELEADNAGITEILEQRSLLLDDVQPQETPSVSTLQPIQPSARNIIPPTAHSHKRKATSMDIFTEDLPNGDISVPVSTVSLPDYSSYSSTLNPYLPMESKISLPSSQSMQYSIGTVGANSSSTSSPSLSDSQSYLMAGRKTTTVKSYAPAIKSEYSGLPINTSLTAAPQLGNPYANSAAGLSVNYASTSSTMASMSHMDLNPQMTSTPTSKQHARKKQKTSAAPVTPVSTVDQVPLQPEVVPQGVDWVYDPNEPRYCLCNQVSYGEMVGCDNPSCQIEWFHYGCVGITDPPKGKWFCPNCIKKKRR